MSSNLPEIERRGKTRRQSMPFETVFKSLDLNSRSNRSEHYSNRKKSQDIFVPSDLKSYDESNLQELSVRTKGKQDEYKQRYVRILRKDPHAFYKLTDEFNFFIAIALLRFIEFGRIIRL